MNKRDNIFTGRGSGMMNKQKGWTSTSQSNEFRNDLDTMRICGRGFSLRRQQPFLRWLPMEEEERSWSLLSVAF